MEHTYVNLDFYNNSLSCKINGKLHIFSSAESFISKTNFPFSDTLRISSYEPERNIFVVEEINGVGKSGSDLPEMVWMAQNLSVIEAAAAQDEQEHPHPSNTPTANMQKIGLLYSTDWVLQRWQEEILLNVAHSMTEEKFNQVLQYRQALRDLSVEGKTINEVTWPANPLE
jgi:hypothetical protein